MASMIHSRLFAFIRGSYLFSLVLTAPLVAQYPMGGPMGGGGIPLPGRHKKKSADKNQNTEQQRQISAEGKTVSNDGRKLIVSVDDGRTLTMTLNQDTKFTHAGNAIDSTKVGPATTVRIVAAEDDQAYLTAVSVDLEKEAPIGSEAIAGGAPPGQGQENAQDNVRPSILESSPDAPDRPILKHGKPQQSSEDEDVDTDAMKAPAKNNQTSAQAKSSPTDFTIGSDSPQVRPVSNQADDFITRTRLWLQSYTSDLPNYICQQDTTRYWERSRSEGWMPQDIVTAKVVYQDGHESYQDITVGGKPTNKSMMEIGGATSTGEFASMLHGLFSEATQAKFKFFRPDSIDGTSAKIYDFTVSLPRSDWTITVGGQSLRPQYSGSVWIDRNTGAVRRIEMQADKIPPDFPMDEIQAAVDYDTVQLGVRSFLLPVHAENLSCERGLSICSKNTIDFRNYHKFETGSTITFGK